MNDEPFWIRRVGQNKIVFLINCREWIHQIYFNFFTSHKELFLSTHWLVCHCNRHHSTFPVHWQRHSSRYVQIFQHCRAPQNASRWRLHFWKLIQEATVPQSDGRWCRARSWFSAKKSFASASRQRWLCSPPQNRSQRDELGLAALLRRTSWLHSVSFGTCGTLGERRWVECIKESFQRKEKQILLNPLVTCNNLSRAVSKELNNFSHKELFSSTHCLVCRCNRHHSTFPVHW